MYSLLKRTIIPGESAGAAVNHGQRTEQRPDPRSEDGHSQEGGLAVRYAALHGLQARIHLQGQGEISAGL